ncbi:MAG TPA: hypothetical protein IAC31_09000 [Candidatus Faecousia intestinigallinarum]|nr:hypothetical protein [Candidatus Faecousia intestinigallinarum]
MIKSLLGVRFRALFAGLTAQNRKKKQKTSKGMLVLFGILYIYVIIVIGGLMGFTFFSLATPYHAMGLDWLYFAMAGLMGLAMAVLGSVFTTQSQLYDAKDNALLLSMPIPPRMILLSRMLPLLALNLLFASVVMIPAIIVYAVFVKTSWLMILLQCLNLLAICVIAQAIACLLGWLLHLLLSKMNKSFASVLYVVAFLAVYFFIYSQANTILTTMTANGQAIASALQTWVWPLYAMGQSCLGALVPFLAFAAISAALFGAVYLVLSLTFLRTATMQRAGRKRKKLDWSDAKVSNSMQAIVRKERRKFLGCPVYLTNMGMGIVLTLALPIAGLIFRRQILEFTVLLEISPSLIGLIICACLAFTISTTCISTPSVSLEGKNIWILKTMPVSSKQILRAKLRFHCLATIPVSAISGLVLALAFGCSLLDAALVALIPGLLSALSGVLGLICGLQWARLDYISEAYPCKQSMSVTVTMFSMMGLPMLLGIAYIPLYAMLTPTLYMALVSLVLAAICLGLYRVLNTWGTKKWESIS